MVHDDRLPSPDPAPDIAIQDILDAMRQTGGYLDVAPADALAVYRLAYAHAAARLDRDVPVRDIMTTDVATVTPDSPVLEAARIMDRAGVSGLPVVSDGTVAGVLSVKDLLRHLGLPGDARPAALLARLLDPATCAGPAAPDAGQTRVAALMTAPAVTIGPDTPRSRAAQRMTEHGINRLPVLDGQRLCGIVSRGDVVRTCRPRPEGVDA